MRLPRRDESPPLSGSHPPLKGDIRREARAIPLRKGKPPEASGAFLPQKTRARFGAGGSPCLHPVAEDRLRPGSVSAPAAGRLSGRAAASSGLSFGFGAAGFPSDPR